MYAGASGPPFTEHTEPAPISAYGRAKLRSEEIATAFAVRTSTALLVGRLANLYGPGQNLDKPQGLISQLCLAQLTRQPLSVYVPLDTMRDYLFVDDAAAMAVAGLGAVTASGRRALKVLASERSTTVGAVLGDLHRVTRRRPPVVLGVSPRSRYQVLDIRLRSVAWPRTTALARTPMVSGIAATLASLRRSRMKLLVTGGAGFIGSHYVRSRADRRLGRHRARSVVVLDKLTYAGNLENLAPVADDDRLRIVEGDILDRPLVDELMADADAVVHFAAESHVDRSILGAADFVMTNVVGTQTLLDSALEHGIDEVRARLHRRGLRLDRGGQLGRGAAAEPNSPYSASKASSDLFARAYHRTHGLPVASRGARTTTGPTSSRRRSSRCSSPT